MSLRFENARNRISLAAVCFAGALACAGPLTGCIVGAGDDRAIRAADGGDARADGPADGAADARPSDANADGSRDATQDVMDATVQETAAAEAAPPPPAVSLSSTAIDFGLVGCGSMPANKTLTMENKGGSPLVISASLVGSAFTVSPTSLMLLPGASGSLMMTATVPGSSTAASPLIGSLALFTNDPLNANRILPISVTPSGATLTGTSVYAFPSSEIGTPAPSLAVQLKNTGNGPGTFAIGAPNDPAITLISSMPDGGLSLAAGETWNGLASFTPTSSKTITAKATITATGVVCGLSLPSVLFTGQGATGTIAGWPSNGAIDFGPVPCGGMALAPQKVTLVNSSPTTAAMVTKVDTTGMNGFTTDAVAGVRIPAAGGTLPINFTAPPVPKNAALMPIKGMLVFQTDADPSPLTITLTEAPQGAVLAFDTTATTNFGSFGTVILLQSATQNFNVTNAGNVPANVTVIASENGSGADAGADASADGGGDAAVDATAGGGSPSFSVSSPVFTLPVAPGSTTPSTQQDSVTFHPMHANQSAGSLALAVDSTTPICSALPAALKLAGNAIGGGPVVAPTALTFGATCGGAAPGSQTFVVANAGTVNLTWTMGPVTGPGAAAYTAMATPAAGVLIPGASATVTVTAAAVPAPAPNPDPASLAAQIAINTDVPFDPTHVVTLSEVPLGDQLSVSPGGLRFGQIPINTSIAQNFAVTNNANPGSPDAKVSLSVVSGLDSGATAYTLQTAGNIAAGGTATESVTFNATTPGAFPATIPFKTTDALCSPLPSPVVLSGTGTGGQLALSSTTLAFGTDAADPNGLVACGKTGTIRTLSLSNAGNQSFHVTGATLGQGATSPFALSGPGLAFPVQLLINAATTITITPSGIPKVVADPNDATVYSDVLTITTDVIGDTPHTVPLVMQPYGAVIAAAPPPQTTWNFGTTPAGSIWTYNSTIRNIGNAPATVSLKGLGQPAVFGLKDNPTTVSPNKFAVLGGQFSPPQSLGTWIDQGQLVVEASAFCQPLPSQWNLPTVNLSGSSNSNSAVSWSGSLDFPQTDCGAAPPALPGITLKNPSNQAYPYTVKFGSGTWYTFSDLNGGMLAANATATIVVNPKMVSPGPGIVPGSAPYADELLVSVATSPATPLTIPVGWTLNGAVLSLPDGTGPNGQGFYVADSTTGFPLRMNNTGSAPVSVDFAVQPLGAFSIQPAPVQVSGSVSPQLVSASTSPACRTTNNGTATFQVTGPVCQPFNLSVVNVHACAGPY